MVYVFVLRILVFKNYMKCICDLLEFIGMLLTESIIKELNFSNVTFIQQVLYLKGTVTFVMYDELFLTDIVLFNFLVIKKS